MPACATSGVCHPVHGPRRAIVVFFFFNDTATTEIYTLSLHDALPISAQDRGPGAAAARDDLRVGTGARGDRKSTRLNSSHGYISYAVFCLKKKKIQHYRQTHHALPARLRRASARNDSVITNAGAAELH